MTKLLIVSIMGLFIVSCATESKVEKTEPVANYDLKSVERLPSQVTGDFGKTFLSAKSAKGSLCSASLGTQIYGNKFGFNNIDEEKAVRTHLKKKLNEEAAIISDKFVSFTGKELKGNQHCEEYAVAAAHDLIERADCFLAVFNTVYNQEGVAKIAEYSQARAAYFKRMELKEKIDAFNMPLVGDNSCISQGIETDHKIVDKNGKRSIPFALFFAGRY